MKKTVALFLALILIFSAVLASCASKPSEDATLPSESAPPSASTEPTPAPDAAPSQEPVQPHDPITVNLAVLSGPTGVGAAKLIADQESGQGATDYITYNYTVAADNQQVTAGLLNGEFDIAALATNVASTLYNKSEGKIQIAAINTLGVLYILGKGVDDTLDTTTLQSLKGRTLYATGQGANPEYVIRYLLTENGLDPDKDVNIVWQAADEVTATMLQAKDNAVCMLPVPAATALQAKSEGTIQPIYNLTEEWDKLGNGSQLTMGCIVVRTAFAQEHPEVVSAFLEEYKASIEYVRDNPGDIAQTVADLGITPSAPIAQKSIPQCNLVCITGAQVRNTIQGYYEVLYAADPAAIGGSIPDDAFYFLG